MEADLYIEDISVTQATGDPAGPMGVYVSVGVEQSGRGFVIIKQNGGTVMAKCREMYPWTEQFSTQVELDGTEKFDVIAGAIPDWADCVESEMVGVTDRVGVSASREGVLSTSRGGDNLALVGLGTVVTVGLVAWSAGEVGDLF